jgi:hypothetical protein
MARRKTPHATGRKATRGSPAAGRPRHARPKSGARTRARSAGRPRKRAGQASEAQKVKVVRKVTRPARTGAGKPVATKPSRAVRKTKSRAPERGVTRKKVSRASVGPKRVAGRAAPAKSTRKRAKTLAPRQKIVAAREAAAGKAIAPATKRVATLVPGALLAGPIEPAIPLARPAARHAARKRTAPALNRARRLAPVEEMPSPQPSSLLLDRSASVRTT